MKLLVGLGNKGKEYEGTRHNIGFMVIDKFASENGVSINKEKFGGLFCEININGEKAILLKPQKYINLSGDVLIKYVEYFNIDIDDILIISDDLDLPIGELKLKYKGGSGGHNGLKNIEAQLKTKEYKRLKIGISNNKNLDTKDYVLGKFSPSDKKLIDQTIAKAVDICNEYFSIKFDNLMNKYN